MQVSSSVSSRYSTPYQTNTSVKYCAGFTQTEDGKITSNETAKNPEFAEFVDYQGFRKAWMSQSRTNPFQYARQKDIAATGSDVGADTEETVDYAKLLEEKINELFVKIQNGDTEPTYQIGSQSFTVKEWEELLNKFDSIEEAIRKLMKEEQARKEAEEAKKESALSIDASTLLTAESTSCVYETADPDGEDLRYITWYTEEGIFCRKAGQTEGYEWSIAFDNREQYDKVMEFIGQFPSDWNMRFAAHENFWNDFLSGEMDMDGFMEFISGTNKGVPDFSITVGDSMHIDRDKIQWAKYTNPLGARFYTAEEMRQMQMLPVTLSK